MFETNVIVAPNSPSAFAKPMMRPASTPGSASGSVIVRNTQKGLRAKRRGRFFDVAIHALDAEAHRADDQRKGHDAGRQRGAGPAERELQTEVLLEPRADRAAAAEDAQQHIAGDDRRHDQRQMHERR